MVVVSGCAVLPVMVAIIACLPDVSGKHAYSIEEMVSGRRASTTTEAAGLPHANFVQSVRENGKDDNDLVNVTYEYVTLTSTTDFPSLKAHGGLKSNAQDAMATLLGSAPRVHHKDNEWCLKDYATKPGYLSQQISSGLIEAFMNKVTLKIGEKECLEQSISDISGEVVDAGNDAVQALKGTIKTNGTTAPSNFNSDTVPFLMDGALKLTSLVSTITSLIKTCVQGDALDILKKAGKHLIDAKWLKSRFWVNGVDIAKFLANGIVSWTQCKFHRFGKDIGTAMRKVALSSATEADTLGIPEGKPEEEAIEEVMQGLLSGFFAKGVDLIIRDSTDPSVDVDVELHRCVVGNRKLFETVWAGVWELIASLAANPDQHDFGFGAGKHPKWMGEFMLAMLQVPSSMAKCGIDAETEQMMMEALKAISNLDVTMTFPNDIAEANTATQKVAKAVEAWTAHDFLSFGREVGKLLRELVLLFFRKKYYVDPSGRLRRQLHIEATTLATGLPNIARSVVTVACVVTVAAFTLLAAVKTLRLYRHARSGAPHNADEADVLE